MAKCAGSVGFPEFSGRVGNGVLERREDGLVLRQYVMPRDPRTPLQQAQRRRIGGAGSVWPTLDPERVAAWRRFAEGHGGASKGYRLFCSLAARRQRIDPSVDLRAFDPPTAAFFGDAARVTVGADASALVFVADRPNADGVVTELLAQRLPSPVALWQTDKFRSQGYVSFSGGPVAVPVEPGAWVGAYRFLDAETGQATGLAELGVVVVGI